MPPSRAAPEGSRRRAAERFSARDLVLDGAACGALFKRSHASPKAPCEGLSKSSKQMEKAAEEIRGGLKRPHNDAARNPPPRRHEAMELLIIRHAIAFARDRGRWRDDAARPLSPAGMRRARKAAAGLKDLLQGTRSPPDQPAASRQADRANSDGGRRLAASGGSARALSRRARAGGADPARQGSQQAHCGRRPSTGPWRSAHGLLDWRRPLLPIEMKKNAVACVSFGGSPRAGRATLRWLATPRMLRGLRHG